MRKPVGPSPRRTYKNTPKTKKEFRSTRLSRNVSVSSVNGRRREGISTKDKECLNRPMADVYTKFMVLGPSLIQRRDSERRPRSRGSFGSSATPIPSTEKSNLARWATLSTGRIANGNSNGHPWPLGGRFRRLRRSTLGFH